MASRISHRLCVQGASHVKETLFFLLSGLVREIVKNSRVVLYKSKVISCDKSKVMSCDVIIRILYEPF